MDGNYIDGLPELVEDDTSDETSDAKIKGRALISVTLKNKEII